MLRKRIIFTLIYSDGFFTQSRNFRLQKVGDLGWLEKHYQFQRISFSIDELIILNASKNAKATTDFASVVSQLTTNVFIPVAVGGGIRTAEDAALLFKNGADKIVLNSALANNPRLVKILIE
ncbi:MAG: putative imidazoleglycerol-phosphate synthase HisF, partial [uncultured bacterium]